MRSISALLACLLLAGCSPSKSDQSSRQTIPLSGDGWRLLRDAAAPWENDELFLPPVDLSKVPLQLPTGGWDSLAKGMQVSVPGTAEEYLGNGLGPEAMVKGVTWWARKFRIPKEAAGRQIRLQFEAARQRAEIYVNRQLAGYDLVGNTPFDVDLTGKVQPGSEVELAVRITNPGGNFAWADCAPFRWGKYSIPVSHGFGGITGEVRLVVTAPVFIDDLTIQNSPNPRNIRALARIRNITSKPVAGALELVICEKVGGREVFRTETPEASLPPGEHTIECPASVPEAKLWDLDNPNLYVAEVRLHGKEQSEDSTQRTFGFRWFSPEGIGSDAVLRLNGKRVVLRTSISWGFWPINGIFPTPELAEKQVRVAKQFGLNMLNFHRCIGNPIVFDKADELGLLYFEEPGGYTSGGTDPFSQALAREKLLRMVRRDRSHPSLVIYNMINENWNAFRVLERPELFALHQRDMADAHALDPSRMLVYTSAWAGASQDPAKSPAGDPAKMNMRPFDPKIYMSGWFDFHRASGPDAWREDFYRDPKSHYGHTDNKAEIVYWGEEGANSSPPRMGSIEQVLRNAPRMGWDGQLYRNFYAGMDAYLDQNKLRGTFPTVEELCAAMGVVSIEHQGRKIEDTRICNANDGYAINGWESEPIENHSGIVDCFRNPKADPAILAYYNQPLYIAVKPRRQIVTPGTGVGVDFHLINEKNLAGPMTLRIRAKAAQGSELFSRDIAVTAAGGETFGQLLAENITIPVGAGGFTEISAELVDSTGAIKAKGADRVFSVDWKSILAAGAGAGRGAILDRGETLHDFLSTGCGLDIPKYDDSMPPLDWILVAKSAVPEPVPIPSGSLRTPEGKPGVRVSFFPVGSLEPLIHQRVDTTTEFSVSSGAAPDLKVPLTENYRVVWEGEIIPPLDGTYEFTMTYRHVARLTIGGQEIGKETKAGRMQIKTASMELKAGSAVPFRIELDQRTTEADDAALKLNWKTPVPETVTPENLLARAAKDGTTIILVDRADSWLSAVEKATGIKQGAPFSIGSNWLGGQYFVRKHPLFEGLPTDVALNWPYQSVIGGARAALELHGAELVAGAYHTWPMQLGSAVSILPHGKGRILFSSLDILPQLADPRPSADVARRLLCNYILFARSVSHSQE